MAHTKICVDTNTNYPSNRKCLPLKIKQLARTFLINFFEFTLTGYQEKSSSLTSSIGCSLIKKKNTAVTRKINKTYMNYNNPEIAYKIRFLQFKQYSIRRKPVEDGIFVRHVSMYLLKV